ncbi:MAG: hypothetical protein ACTHW2_05380 [Tissierella sp.]|uniref:hypothetical protein n=1 Tax=Tissierella sp. TaxID=41274 RepID=UPI003F9E9CD0
MRRKIISLCIAFVLIFPVIFSNYSFADELQEEVVVSKEKIDDNLSIEILNDGRVAPRKSSIEISEENLDTILKKIGYDENIINSWDIARKRNFVNKGGKVVDTELVSLEHNYISKDGKKHKVTSNNLSRIQKIQLSDLKSIGIEGEEAKKHNLLKEDKARKSFETFGYKVVGDWFGQISVLYLGETSTQYKFGITVDYNWDKNPAARNTDSVGLFWGNIAQPLAGTHSGKHAALISGRGWVTNNHEIDVASTLGVRSQFKLNRSTWGGVPTKQMGFLEQSVNVNKSRAGQKLAISGKYVHPWIPSGIGISIGAGGLSIDGALDGMADDWSWQVNFTP